MKGKLLLKISIIISQNNMLLLALIRLRIYKTAEWSENFLILRLSINKQIKKKIFELILTALLNILKERKYSENYEFFFFLERSLCVWSVTQILILSIKWWIRSEIMNYYWTHLSFNAFFRYHILNNFSLK